VQQHPRDGVKELGPPTLVGLMVHNDGARGARTQLGDESRQLPRRHRRQARFRGEPGPVRGVVAKCLHERLIRRDALLVGPPIEHDGALTMGCRRESRRQARLADARFAGEQHEAGPGLSGRLPAATQPQQRVRATGERPLLQPPEHARQRQAPTRPLTLSAARRCRNPSKIRASPRPAAGRSIRLRPDRPDHLPELARLAHSPRLNIPITTSPRRRRDHLLTSRRLEAPPGSTFRFWVAETLVASTDQGATEVRSVPRGGPAGGSGGLQRIVSPSL
jgi:hypothetical protein